MDILQLEHFLAVVEERTFTRAAERAGRTQPAISQSIKRLEEAVGATLFARGVHEVTLTKAGEVLVLYAQRMLALREETKEALRGLRRLATGSVSVGAHESAAVYLLPGPIQRFLQRFPDIKVCVHRTRAEEIPRQVAEGQIDLGFVTVEPTIRDLRMTQVYMDRLILIASPRHPFSRRATVTVADLEGERFVVHTMCMLTLRQIRAVFEQNGVPFRVSAELSTFEAVKDFVQRDLGLAIVPRTTVRPQVRDGLLVEVPLTGLQIARRTLAIFRERQYMSDASRELLNIVQAYDWHGQLMGHEDDSVQAAHA